MKKNKIDPKTLSGEGLFYYYTNDHEDKNYSSIVKMLIHATDTMEEAYRILEKAVKEDKRLVAVYPGEGEAPTEDMTLVGPIIDGALYIK